MMEYSFWLSVLIIFYTYFGYPILLMIIEPPKSSCNDVTNMDFRFEFLVLAYNEEKVIKEKIENSLLILKNFKNAKLRVVSDGSSDMTNIICESFSPHPQFIFTPLDRSGKSQAINKIISSLDGEIVVFSDANVEYSEKTLIKLLKPYVNPRIGFTCGKVIYKNPGEIVSGKGESFYWKYENLLKKQESKIGFIAGATGAVYSIRRKLFIPLKLIGLDSIDVQTLNRVPTFLISNLSLYLSTGLIILLSLGILTSFRAVKPVIIKFNVEICALIFEILFFKLIYFFYIFNWFPIADVETSSCKSVIVLSNILNSPSNLVFSLVLSSSNLDATITSKSSGRLNAVVTFTQ